MCDMDLAARRIIDGLSKILFLGRGFESPCAEHGISSGHYRIQSWTFASGAESDREYWNHWFLRIDSLLQLEYSYNFLDAIYS